MLDIPASAGLHISEWSPGELAETAGGHATSISYLEMVRVKIERHKRYPAMAMVRNIEGCVVIGFVITPEGTVREVQVAKCSIRKDLNNAA